MSRLIWAALAAVLLAFPARAEVEVQEVTSPDGIDAWLVEEHSIPFLALELRFRGGASLDPAERMGATSLMTYLLEEGAGDLDSQGFTAATESLAAEFRFDSGHDVISVSAKVLTENRDDALDLLRMALVEPSFDQESVDRVRKQMIASVESDTTDPDEISMQTFTRMAFPGHPYALSSDGTVESLSALTRDDIVQAHERAMARDNVVVSAVGDITAEEFGQLLDRLLGDLPETAAEAPQHVDYALDGGTTVVEFDTPQSVVTFGQRGMERHDPDFYTAYVMMHILGGSGFSSRLTTEVREKRGLTYGIGTYLYPRDYSEMIVGTVSTMNERVGETLAVVQDEWERLATEGVTDEELERAKTYMTGAYPLRFDGNQRIARILVGMQMDDLTPEYLRNRNDLIRAVTVEDIRRVAAELIDPEGLHFVVVGKPVGLEATN